MAKSNKVSELDFLWTPRGPAQKLAKEVWKRSRILFLTGIAGSGKTNAALGLALTDIFKSNTLKLKLARPQVGIGNEKQPFLPGNVEEKLGPWLYPLHDVWEDMSNGSDFAKLVTILGPRLELLSISMARGRTIKNGILIVDESQNLRIDEIKCILTRIGDNGRIIFTGDTNQSDLYRDPLDSPLAHVTRVLDDIDTINTVRFTHVDQQRDPLVNLILERL